jgi:shikimate dehydrogenase
MDMSEGDPLSCRRRTHLTRDFRRRGVMKTEMTAFLKAVQGRGCRFQVGSDMLFEQIPAYLEFFGFPTTTPDVLRSLAT